MSRWLSPLALPLAISLLALLVTACAPRPPADDKEAVADYRETNDPLEPTNRFFYKTNDQLDAVTLKPAAEAYRYVLPDGARESVHNMLVNLNDPTVFFNDVVEAEPRRAGDTLMRFLINSTLGVGGFFDVAKHWGYPNHDADFGMTLALYGVPPGPYLFLPIIGPSNPRDLAGFGVDIADWPFTWMANGTTIYALEWAYYGLNAIDVRSRVLDSLDQVQKTALDPYATIRSLYRQRRESQIEAIRNDHRATVPAWFPAPAPQTE